MRDLSADFKRKLLQTIYNKEVARLEISFLISRANKFATYRICMSELACTTEQYGRNQRRWTVWETLNPKCNSLFPITIVVTTSLASEYALSYTYTVSYSFVSQHLRCNPWNAIFSLIKLASAMPVVQVAQDLQPSTCKLYLKESLKIVTETSDISCV
jgi:hypothetical protein